MFSDRRVAGDDAVVDRLRRERGGRQRGDDADDRIAISARIPRAR